MGSPTAVAAVVAALVAALATVSTNLLVSRRRDRRQDSDRLDEATAQYFVAVGRTIRALARAVREDDGDRSEFERKVSEAMDTSSFFDRYHSLMLYIPAAAEHEAERVRDRLSDLGLVAVSDPFKATDFVDTRTRVWEAAHELRNAVRRLHGRGPLSRLSDGPIELNLFTWRPRNRRSARP